MQEFKLTSEEARVIIELRKMLWGHLTVTKKGNSVVMITAAHDIKMSKERPRTEL